MNKQQLRTNWRLKRRQIPHSRRQEASLSALRHIQNSNFEGFVLSYASFGDELETGLINAFLAEQGRLVLPKMEGERLDLYHIENPKRQLRYHPYGIPEPIPELCREVKANSLKAILVPGLVFDQARHRLGYGKGYYDRFLKELRLGTPAYGLGFCEQLSAVLLPVEPTDAALDSLMLF